jgi:hypothetical protein
MVIIEFFVKRTRSPSTSITLSVMVNLPAVEKVWTGFSSVEFLPSPKFHKKEAGAFPRLPVKENLMPEPSVALVAVVVSPRIGAPV